MSETLKDSASEKRGEKPPLGLLKSICALMFQSLCDNVIYALYIYVLVSARITFVICQCLFVSLLISPPS